MIEPIRVENLTLGYGEKIVLNNISFSLPTQTITVIMGGSGNGKSTLLKALIGLLLPKNGKVYYDKASLYDIPQAEREVLLRQIGVLYQGGALWSDRTVAENIAFPLEEFCPQLPARQIKDIVQYKLSLVGMSGTDDLYPEQLSGGMRKRAALARAMALDPKVLFLDEPSAGLDPYNARRLDDLIVHLREGLGTSFVVITHDLESIHAIAQHCIYIEGGKVASQGTIKEIEMRGTEGAKEFLRGYAPSKKA